MQTAHHFSLLAENPLLRVFFSLRTADVSPLGFFSLYALEVWYGTSMETKTKTKKFQLKKEVMEFPAQKAESTQRASRETNLSVSKRELFYLKTLRWIYCETLLLSRYV